MMRFGLCAVLLLPVLTHTALAAESQPVQSPRVTASLISDTDQVQAGSKLRLGLRLRMAPGWHTYWQNPGDAGSAPELKLTLPEGAKAGPIEWPVPQRLPEGPIMTYGYTGEVMLPVTVTPGPGPLTVTAQANWLVCEKICVPEAGTFTLDLPPGIPSPSAQAAALAKAVKWVPHPSPFQAGVAPDGSLVLSGDGLSPATVKDAWFFPTGWGVVDQGAPQPVSVSSGEVRLRLTPGAQFKPDAPLDGVVVLRDAGGQESAWQVSALPGAPMARAPVPWWHVLGLALLGGLILNLMPCVFPILAVKAVSLAKMSGKERGAARMHAAFYTAGVVVAFLALAGLLLALRAAGTAVGWGFQFQSPVFVAVMAWVLLGVGLNLSGLFQVGAGLGGVGQGLAARSGHAGDFFTGLLAVVVATPCTAPFMGVAIASALAAPAWATVLVFTALGLGLAAPYVALATIPGLVRLMPRPGRWMGLMKGLLAFPMYGAAAWLVWVISLEAGPTGVLVTAAGMVLVAFAGWAFGIAQVSGGRIGRAAAVLALAGAVAVLPTLVSAGPGPQMASESAEPFSPERLKALRAEGRPVFVNMTAAWCVTCLLNEKVALSPEPVRQAFATHKVAYLKGDWTRGDPAITAYLRQHQRDGVPLYALYPPGAGEPEILPQILTQADMLQRLKQIGG